MSGIAHSAERSNAGARLLVLLLAPIVLLELGRQMFVRREFRRMPMGTTLRRLLGPSVARYLPVREWVLAHPALAGLAGLILLALVVATARAALMFWHNQVVARLAGTHFATEDHALPTRKVDLFAEICRRPKGHTFVGLTPRRGLFGWRWRPAYISPRQRTMHRHVMGRTGSGKTQSILWPQVLQDALDGKGVVVMSAKGSAEEISVMKGIATVAGRKEQLRVFSLPAWNQPRLPSHTYNMVYVQPRTPTSPGGDPAPVAERVFGILPLGDNDYYRVQAQLLFGNVCKLLHGMVDERGHGLPFVMRDVSVFLKGIGGDGAWADAVDYCLRQSLEQEAAEEIRSQVHRLGRDVEKTFTGLIGAVDKFLSPIVNAYAPDIVFEEVLEKNGLVYVQLPANLFKVQAPALGRAVLMDVQQEGSQRQVSRTSRNQNPFAVVVDEFYNFADPSIIDSLNKLRDANLEFTLAHQSPADLELVSREFATAVWDNCRTRDLLSQDNPELCERIARGVGTHKVVERTVRRQQGAFFSSLITGDASSKQVETFRLHPNQIKGLARCGQGYLLNDEGVSPLVYGMLPDLAYDYPLKVHPQENARGLRLYEQFIQPSTLSPTGLKR
jgi:type IV secretory pathway TraG/TraD family ATPase VirD4